MTLSGATCAVLGATGFLGSYLVAALAAEGARVRAVTRRPLPASVLGIPDVAMCQADMLNPPALARAFDGADCVFHLASTTVPATSELNQQFDISTNLVGSVNVLESMRRAGVRKIVFASSGGAVYGHQSRIPIPETAELRPLTSYGIVKIAIESYIKARHASDGLSYSILRCSNPYGTRHYTGGVQGVIPLLVRKIAHGEEITLFGADEVLKDYVFVDDVTRAFVEAASRDVDTVLNIGSGEGTTLATIMAMLAQTQGRPIASKVSLCPRRPFDPLVTVLDIRRARRLLQWQAKVSLADGLRRVWRESREIQT